MHKIQIVNLLEKVLDCFTTPCPSAVDGRRQQQRQKRPAHLRRRSRHQFRDSGACVFFQLVAPANKVRCGSMDKNRSPCFLAMISRISAIFAVTRPCRDNAPVTQTDIYDMQVTIQDRAVAWQQAGLYRPAGSWRGPGCRALPQRPVQVITAFLRIAIDVTLVLMQERDPLLRRNIQHAPQPVNHFRPAFGMRLPMAGKS